MRGWRERSRLDLFVSIDAQASQEHPLDDRADRRADGKRDEDAPPGNQSGIQFTLSAQLIGGGMIQRTPPGSILSSRPVGQ